MKAKKKENKTSRSILCICLVFVFILLTSIPVFASSPSGFSIEAILPENQTNNDISYFDLKMEPGLEQTIQVETYNDEDVAIIVSLSLHTGYTSDNGIIDYLDEVEQDESMNVCLTDIATIREKELRLEPGETKAFTIDIKMPTEEFDGVLLGGLIATSEYADKVNNEEEETFSIENRFAYILGLVLRETDEKVEPSFELKNVEIGLTNLRPDIKLNIQNTAALIVKEMKVKADVTQKGSEEVLYSLTINEADMAPNSNANFLVSLENQEVKPGDYTVHLTLSYGSKEWKWDEDFTIQDDQAKDINAEAVVEEVADKASLPTWVYIVIGVGGGLILILFIVLLVTISKKRKAEQDYTKEIHKKTYTRPTE